MHSMWFKMKNFSTMVQLKFSIQINAPKEKVWRTMLEDATYRQWTSAFGEGSSFVGDWNEGSKFSFWVAMAPRASPAASSGTFRTSTFRFCTSAQSPMAWKISIAKRPKNGRALWKITPYKKKTE